MPILIVTTNLNFEETVVDSFIKKSIMTLSRILKKPERLFMVGVNQGAKMVFECNGEGALYGEFVGQGDMDNGVKKQIITAISTVVEDILVIPNTRMFLKVYDTVWGKKIMTSKL